MDTLEPQFDYAPAPTQGGPSILRARYGMLAGGAWSEAAGGVFATVDPATEKPLAEVARASSDDVERAVRAARRGYEKYWRKLRPSERAKHLFRLSRAVSERARELALVQTLDAGTPIRRSREHDVPSAIATLFTYAGWADKLAWAVRAGERTRPLGVVASFGSGSSPALEAACALGPALAAGNAAIFVPSEHAPLAALVLAQAGLEADLPPGVLSIVTGDARTRNAFVDNADVDAIATGGAREACAAIARALAGTQRRAVLRPELPGIVIVCDDAPLDAAVEGIVRSALLERGPYAPDALRVLVQESILSETIALLHERLRTLRIGDPLDENSDGGPALTDARREDLETFVKAALEAGATVARGVGPLPERGFWHVPAVPLFGFRTIAEALEKAHAFGRIGGAGIWTSSGQGAVYLAERLAAETVWCNGYARFDPTTYAGGAAALRAYLHT